MHGLQNGAGFCESDGPHGGTATPKDEIEFQFAWGIRLSAR